MKPAVVLAGHTVGLGVTRALARMGVPVVMVYYDDGDMGYVSKYVQMALPAPDPRVSQEAFVEFLLECGPRFEGGFLIPTSDPGLTAAAAHKPLLERHYMVAANEWEIAGICLDKKLTQALAERLQVPAPKSLLPQCTQDLEEAAETIRFPCLVKPTHGYRYFDHFKRKMTRADTFRQLRLAYEAANAAGLEVMVQEFIPGDDLHGVNYNSYWWDGEPLVEFTAQKLRNGPPWYGSPRVAVSDRVPEVLESGRTLLRGLGYQGFACTEFKWDPRDGAFKLMEINARHNLSTLLAVRAGVNFPWLHYSHLMLGERPKPQEYRTGIYWIDLTRDLSFSLTHLGREGLSPRQYLLPYLRPHVFAILDWRDPRPFFKRIADVARNAPRPKAPMPLTPSSRPVIEAVTDGPPRRGRVTPPPPSPRPPPKEAARR